MPRNTRNSLTFESPGSSLKRKKLVFLEQLVGSIFSTALLTPGEAATNGFAMRPHPTTEVEPHFSEGLFCHGMFLPQRVQVPHEDAFLGGIKGVEVPP